MLTYRFIARNTATGEKVKSIVQADNEKAANKLISDRGLTPIEIKLQSDSTKGFGRITNRIKSKDRVLFARQLSTLINAGLPLVQSLRSVKSQTRSKALQLVVEEIIVDVEGGSAFSAALGKHKHVFNEIFVSLVAAGEVSGTLDKALERIANQQEKDAELLSKVRGAMIYPIVVLSVMLLVVSFMIIKVLPQVEIFYEGLPGAKLPLITKILLAVSHFAVKFWWAIALFIGLCIFATSRWINTVGGRSAADKFKMKAWPIGTLFMKMYMARFARTAQTLVASGVPLLQTLEVVARAVNNVHIAASIRSASEKVKSGKALSEAIANDSNFLELVPNMISIGEQSGSLEAMLEKVATYFEKEVDEQIKAISTIIEPVMMIGLGIAAMVIVAAILLPVYGLVGQGVIK